MSSDAALAQAQAERNYKIAQQERAEARRLADIEAELARAKRKREANAPLPKSTLGDDLGEVDDATAWVARSRAAKKDAKDPARRPGGHRAPSRCAAYRAAPSRGAPRIERA